MTCQTLGCQSQPTHLLVWHDDSVTLEVGGQEDQEPICTACADGYARRPALMRVAHIENRSV